MQTIPDPQKVNKCIGRRKEGPKRVLTSSEHSYIINHNRINAEKQTGQTDERTDGHKTAALPFLLWTQPAVRRLE